MKKDSDRISTRSNLSVKCQHVNLIHQHCVDTCSSKFSPGPVSPHTLPPAQSNKGLMICQMKNTIITKIFGGAVNIWVTQPFIINTSVLMLQTPRMATLSSSPLDDHWMVVASLKTHNSLRSPASLTFSTLHSLSEQVSPQFAQAKWSREDFGEVKHLFGLFILTKLVPAKK